MCEVGRAGASGIDTEDDASEATHHFGAHQLRGNGAEGLERLLVLAAEELVAVGGGTEYEQLLGTVEPHLFLRLLKSLHAVAHSGIESAIGCSADEHLTVAVVNLISSESCLVAWFQQCGVDTHTDSHVGMLLATTNERRAVVFGECAF